MKKAHDFAIERKLTYHGFQSIAFQDHHRQPCILQQAGVPRGEGVSGSSAVWVGASGDEDLGEETSRMYLDRDRVQWLLEELSYWLQHGQFRRFRRKKR